MTQPYSNPNDDIEVWVFLKPPSPPSDGGSGGGTSFPEERVDIDSSKGGRISFEGIIIEIPPFVLPGDATITVNKLAQEELAAILSDNLGIILGGYIYEINTSGETYFGEDKYITIIFKFNPAELPLGQRPVVRYYDEEQGKWVDIETDIEYDEETEEWKAVIKVNHLTKFAVFSAPWRPYLDDRYLTAVAVSQSGWKTSEYAVLVRGDEFSDALSAGPLAYKYGGPVLLTQTEQISKDTLNELRRLGVKHLFIVGGPSAVSTDVEETVRAAGINVERIYGTDRYETSVKVADKVGHNGGLFLTVGNDFPDALSASAIASRLGMPILLTYKDELPHCAANYLESNPVDTTYVLGGTGVISAEVESILTNPVRLAGKDRYETNIAILEHFGEKLDWERIYAATGSEFADALTGGVLASITSSPMILTGRALPEATAEYIKTKIMPSTSIIPLGGEKAVPDRIITDITSLIK